MVERFTWGPPGSDETTTYKSVYMTSDWIEIASVRYILISIHVFAILASALGNGLLIYLILRNKKFRKHITAYLVLNLALCDFLDAVVHQPMRLADIIAMDTAGDPSTGYSMPQAYCQVTGFFSTYVSCVASHTIMAISWERFLLICKPLQSKRILTVSYTKHLLFIIWSIAFLVVLPLPLLYTYVAQVQLESGFVSFCLIDVFHTKEHNGNVYFLFLFIIYFAIPSILTAVSYGFVFRKLNKDSGCIGHVNEQTLKILQSRKDVAKLMVFLAVLFISLHGPFFFLFLLISFGLKTPSNPIFTLLIIEFLPLLNGALDPIVYSSKSRSLFRKHMVSFLHKQYSVVDHNSVEDRRKSLGSMTSSLIARITSGSKGSKNSSRRGSSPSVNSTIIKEIKNDVPISGASGSYRKRSFDSSRSVSTNSKLDGSICRSIPSRSCSESPSRKSSSKKLLEQSESLQSKRSPDVNFVTGNTSTKSNISGRNNVYDNVTGEENNADYRSPGNGNAPSNHVTRKGERKSQSVERDLLKSNESSV